MLTISNTTVNGWDAAFRGMRNPYNSWAKSDTTDFTTPVLGEKDLKLARSLAMAGTDDGKYLRFIICTTDLACPFYFLKELDTYRVGVEKNSCSTMHNIADKVFTLQDFSTEHMTEDTLKALKIVLAVLNMYRDDFIKSNKQDKEAWWQLIQMLPNSYNQKRTYQFSYAALRNIYKARNDHKLDEWRTFCSWIKSLPYSELITD